MQVSQELLNEDMELMVANETPRSLIRRRLFALTFYSLIIHNVVVLDRIQARWETTEVAAEQVSFLQVQNPLLNGLPSPSNLQVGLTLQVTKALVLFHMTSIERFLYN